MKENSNILKYQLKGFMTNLSGDTIEALDKKENLDTISLDQFVLDVKEWCERNLEKSVDITFQCKASE